MATIKTAIELQDNFTGVLYQVIDVIDMGLSAMEDLHQTMNDPVETTSVEAARNSINQATIAVQQLDKAIQKIKTPIIEIPVTLQNSDIVVLPVQLDMEFPKGQLKDIATEGQITAIIAKEAMFAVADETNTKFTQMPQTFEQIPQTFEPILTSLENTAMMALQPLLENLNKIANSDSFQEIVNHAVSAFSMLIGIANPIIEKIANSDVFITFVNNAIEGFSMVAGIALEIFDLLVSVASVVADNWSWIAPIIYGVATALVVYYGIVAISKGINTAMAAAQMMYAAVTRSLTAAKAADIAAQNGLNAALYACPIMWIIILIIVLIALVYAVVAIINKVTGSTISATGIIMGAIYTIGAYLFNSIAHVWNIIASFIEFFVNVWKNPEFAIKAFVVNIVTDFLSFLLACVQGTQGAIGAVVGIWYAFVQILRNIVAIIWNTFSFVIEAIVNGWNAAIYQIRTFFINLAIAALGVAQSITQGMGDAASAIANMFISAINVIIRGLNGLIDAINCVPGVNIGKIGEIEEVSWDFGASAIADKIGDLKAAIGDTPEEWKAPTLKLGDIGDAYNQGKEIGADLVSGWESSLSGTITNLEASIADKPEDYWEAPKLDYINLSDAAVAGYKFGEGIDESIANFDPSSLFGGNEEDEHKEDKYSDINSYGGSGFENIGSGVNDIAGNTGAIADSMDITEEDLKYLRDIAEQEAINRFTTAEITIEQTNHNNISSKIDLDGVVSGLTDAVNEAVDIITEGVHN